MLEMQLGWEGAFGMRVEYERGDETYRDGDHAALAPADPVAGELNLLGVELYGYSDGVVGVSGADELDDGYRPLRLFPDHAPGTTGGCVTRLAAVLFDDTRILPLAVGEGQQPWQAIRDLPHSWEAIPRTAVLVEADGASGTRRVRLYAV